MNVAQGANLDWCAVRNQAQHAICTLGPHSPSTPHDWAGLDTFLGRAIVRALAAKKALHW